MSGDGYFLVDMTNEDDEDNTLYTDRVISCCGECL